MIRYRSFLNADTPAIAHLWRTQPPIRGRLKHVSPSLLERMVFSKPYFDPDGLIVAQESTNKGHGIVGLAHAGFGPTEDPAEDRGLLDTEFGTTCMLLVSAHEEQREIQRELLRRSERYLRDRGAKVFYGGGLNPMNPFYVGLYGGSEVPGILSGDELQRRAFEELNYRQVSLCRVLQLRLGDVRASSHRDLILLKRKYKVRVIYDPNHADWWNWIQWAPLEVRRFELVEQASSQVLGSTLVWRMLSDPDSNEVAFGLVNLHIDANNRRRKLGTFLVNEVGRVLKSEGGSVIEAQTMEENKPAQAFYSRLGFFEVDHGFLMRKD